MITPELRTCIRRLFFAEHWTIGTIATELDIHHDTVERAIESHRFASARSGPQIRPTLLDDYKAFIADVIAQHPQLRATRIHEMIRARGYAGSVIQVRRYLRGMRPTPREAFLRLQTLPGEQAQVDWGHFGKITVGKARRTLSCFVLVLGWSRAMCARFALDQTLESFLRGHIEAFTALGGSRSRSSTTTSSPSSSSAPAITSAFIRVSSRSPLPLRAEAVCSLSRAAQGVQRVEGGSRQRFRGELASSPARFRDQRIGVACAVDDSIGRRRWQRARERTADDIGQAVHHPPFLGLEQALLCGGLCLRFSRNRDVRQSTKRRGAIGRARMARVTSIWTSASVSRNSRRSD